MHRSERTGSTAHPLEISDIRGWDVISADAVRVGRVHDVLQDGRYLDVELVPTLPGSPHPNETLNPKASTLTDPDPTVAETKINEHYNAGARQHAGAMPGAAPRDSPRDAPAPEELTDGEGPHVRIPADHVRLREGENRVFLETLRSQEIAELPRTSRTN